MSGAYVSKPEVIPPIVYPPNWDPHWKFPGPPFAPGYSPSYEMSLTADGVVSPGVATSSINLGVSDGGYKTAAPSGQASWSATFQDNGQTCQLHPSSGGAFADVATSDYTGGDGVFGSQPSFLFNITSGDTGRTIVLKADGSPFGSDLNSTANMLIGVPDKVVITTTLTLLTGEGASIGPDIHGVELNDNAIATYQFTSGSPVPHIVAHSSNYTIAQTGGNLIVITINLFPSVNYHIKFDSHSVAPNPTNWSANAKFYINDVVTQEFNKSFSKTGELQTNWLSYNKSTKAVTVF